MRTLRLIALFAILAILTGCSFMNGSSAAKGTADVSAGADDPTSLTSGST